jgi:hypothetical protein
VSTVHQWRTVQICTCYLYLLRDFLDGNFSFVLGSTNRNNVEKEKQFQLLLDRRSGRPERLFLSPSTWQGDPLPTPGLGESDVTTPYYRRIAGTTVASLLRGMGGL